MYKRLVTTEVPVVTFFIQVKNNHKEYAHNQMLYQIGTCV